MRRPLLAFTIVALAVLAIDQVTKSLVRASLHIGESVQILRGVFYLTFVRNEGAAFGLMPGRQPLFVVVTLLVLSAIVVFWWRIRPESWLVVISLGLVFGGAIGNLIDRVAFGKVTDFFDASFLRFPVFNVADSAVVVGTAILIVWLLFSPEHGAVHHESDEAAEEPAE